MDGPFCVGVGVVHGDFDGHVGHLHGGGRMCDVCAKSESVWVLRRG
jgi:hypothetical protein